MQGNNRFILMSLPSNTTKVLSSLAARSLNIMLTLALTPLYISYLGMGSYGLIGVLVLVQSIAMLLEFGLPLVLTRSISKLRATPKFEEKISKLFKSFEIIFYLFALLSLSIGVAILWINPTLIHSSSLPDSIVFTSLILIFLQASFRLPLIIYQSVLTGFEKIVDLSLFSAVFIMIRLGGSAVLLVFFSIDIVQFFLYQLVVLIAEVIYARRLCWNISGLNIKTSFSFKYAYSEIKFIKVSFLVTLLGVFLAQFDRFILTTTLSLEEFGMYSLVALFGSAITVLGYPIGSVSFPAFSKSVQSQNFQKLAGDIEQFLNIKFVLILPIGLFAVVYVKELIPFYIGSNMSTKFIDILPIYMLGAIFAALIPSFNGLILSSNSPSNSLKVLLVMSIIYLPMLPFLINTYGIVGASSGFLLMQFGLFSSYIAKSFSIFENINVLEMVIRRLLIPGVIIFLILFLTKYWLNEFIDGDSIFNLMIMLTVYVVVQISAYIFWRMNQCTQ
jgi:O-antigen/teichoic acid export membrane protein